MVRPAGLLGLSLLLVLTGCADTGAGGSAGAPTGPSGEPGEAFTARAERVAAAWRGGPAAEWGKGFMPLEPLTVAPDGVTFTEATKQAFGLGWYRLATAMPREAGGRTGQIRYAGGATETVPLVALAQAYGELDQGDPPPCPGPSIPPPPDAPPPDAPPADAPPGDAPAVQPESVPDLPVSDAPAGDRVAKPCLALTVTAARLGTATVRTGRGPAEVPAWLFTVRELRVDVARVAVAPSAITPVPEVRPGDLPGAPGLLGGQDLTGTQRSGLTYRLGVGSCDEEIRPLAYETDDVVVVGGATGRRRPGACPDNLLLRPVTVELDEPLGARPVLDVLSGRVLTTAPVG
jgi:hypothetical protein